MADNVKAFFSAWCEADEGKQAEAIATALAPDARYADPRTSEPLIGAPAIAGYVSQFTKMAPGAVAEVVRNDSRDGVARVTVEFRMADGKTQLGQYFIETNTDGRPTRFVGFIGVGSAE